jgi:hypothetical protein
MIKSLRKLKNIRYGEVTGCTCLMTVEGVDEIYPIWRCNTSLFMGFTLLWATGFA